MKKKKGFTLVELLAVIVILAIIALVTIPIILNMISKSRKRAAVAATYGYVDAIEYSISLSDIKDDLAARGMLGNMKLTIPNKKLDTEIPAVNLPDNTYTVEEIDAAGVRVKGKKPTSGNVTITRKKVSHANICIGGYNVEYNGKEAEAQDKCGGSEQASTTYTLGQLVYFDPASNDTCNSSTFDLDKIKDGTSTCYKWRVITTDDNSSKDNITLQMDHNLIDNDTLSDSLHTGPTALAKLAEATSNWDDSLLLNYTYDKAANTNPLGILTCTNGTCTVTTLETASASASASDEAPTEITTTIATNLKARLITMEEIAEITKTEAPSFNLTDNNSPDEFSFSRTDEELGTRNNGTGNKNLSWLVENTKSSDSSGATLNIYVDGMWYNGNSGYWTLTGVRDANTTYVVTGDGHTYYFESNSADGFGLRPVITIEKSKLSS